MLLAESKYNNQEGIMSDRIIQQANLDAISNNLSAIHGELERIDINVGTE